MKQIIRWGLVGLCGLIFSLMMLPLSQGLVGHPPTVQAIEHGPLIAQSVVEPPPESDSTGTPSDPDSLKPFAEVTKDLRVHSGLFTVYEDTQGGKALLGVQPEQLNQNLLLIATLESGIGEAGLFRGWPVSDFMIQFRRTAGNRLQVVVPNTYFRNPQSLPQDRQLLQSSFSDSILAGLPILSIHPDSGEMLIDLNDFLLTRDLGNLVGSFPWVLSSYSPNPETSYLGKVGVFPGNVELEAVLGLTGGGGELYLGSLPDSRGFSLRVRYSLSSLPYHPDFQPRSADQRVGYFITAYRTPIQGRSSDPFVRYIHRWHLKKQDANAALSPPKQPIVFWLENTIPELYRQAIREGVEWWNVAFERAGFIQALEVRQMPDNADWDPADVRYNVIRWSDSFEPWALGLGPSRVNPLTGEILDADVILDASVIGYLTQQHQTFDSTLESITQSPLLQLCGPALGNRLMGQLAVASTAPTQRWPLTTQAQPTPSTLIAHACAGMKAFQTMTFGAISLDTLSSPLTSREAQDAYIQEYLRALTAHEVGHVLGLRHNFLGSTLLPLEALNDVAITQSQGLVSSVMDYFPPNLAPPGQTQGDYFPTRLGPYDLWAIEYGYKPTPNLTTAQRELQQIVSRASGPELAFASDEDIYDFLDPKASPWDLSRDPLGYAEGQMAISKAIWAKLNWFSLDPGETYGLLRRRVDLVFNHYQQQAMIISNYIGGQRFNRTDPWSSRGRPAFEPVPAAEQRRALTILNQSVLAEEALRLPPELISLLAPDRWLHWGQPLTLYPLDYPIYDRILFVQALVLSDLLYGNRLVRVRDAELKATGADVLTLAELFDTLGQFVWAEILNPAPEPASLSSLRRGLQRHHLNILTRLFLRNTGPDAVPTDLLDYLAIETAAGAPEDARLLARHQLRQIQTAVGNYANRFGHQLDTTTLAYLEDVGDRITRILEASIIRQ